MTSTASSANGNASDTSASVSKMLGPECYGTIKKARPDLNSERSSQRSHSQTIGGGSIIGPGNCSLAFCWAERRAGGRTGIPMTGEQGSLCTRLKGLGFTQGNQMKLYGQEFELLSQPIVMGDNLVFVDAIEKRSGKLRRVRIPLPSCPSHA